MEFRILGSLEVVDRGRALSLGAKQRALLAFLLLHPNEVVSSDRLIDALWGERPPETAQAALQVHVSQLRKALETARIETRAPGYLLRLEPDELDASRFEALRAEGRGREALALWRGPALADFQNEPWAQGEIARLEEARLTAVEERIEADLAQGRHAQLVSELEALVREQPLRERLRGQLMLALYRCGRQAAALALYQESRRLLVQELGIEPGPELQRLHRQLLNQDPALAPSPRTDERRPGPPPEPREERKVVTVLFCDLVESTALADRLDPEVQRRVLSRYFDTVSHLLERHGGTVEKFIGDAVMAVFGVPRLHEDDALRAVRAAAELQEALEALSSELARDHGVALRARIGVNSGEVIVGGRPLVTGEAVNLAAHLEQAAPPGQVLVGETTFGLVREAVRGEPVELELRGKPSAVRAWRLLELVPGAAPFARRLDTPLVGRELELEQLRQGLARAVRERRSVLLTVLGAAGIGKTRLVGEFVASVAPGARALVGRCLPYGEGITFWPLVEIVRELAGVDPRERLLELLSTEEERAAVVESILGAVGDATASTEESFWAVRKLFESLARERPLVVCFEDVHWAEATLLDLIEHLTEWTSDAPLLLLCLARPEFLDEHEAWAARGLNARSIVLDPLTEQESEELIDLLGDAPLEPERRARLRERSGGNPLFVEQMLAHLNETPGADDRSVPPTVHALLATRLERLDPGERAVIERAAVVGQEFWLRAVSDLVANGSEAVRGRLQALVRKELVRPHRSFLSGEDAFVFNHVLIRDAAYRSISKGVRAELHERFADWVERKPGEYEEIFAYHLEQAYLYRSELGPLGDRERALGEKAAGLLHSVGRRALRRGDLPAAENLLSRAATVLEPDAALLSTVRRDLAIAHYSTGRLKDAETILVSLVESAVRSRDRAAEWAARTELALNHMATAAGVEQSGQALEVGLRAAEILEQERDEAGLARAWLLVSEAHNWGGRQTARREAAERALAIARRAGDDETERRALGNIGGALFIGPTPAVEGIQRMEPELAGVRASGRLAIEATALGNLGILEALRANFHHARAHFERRMSIFEDLGLATLLGTSAIIVGQAEVLANRTEAAADAFRRGYDLLAGLGETGVSCTLAAMLGNALAALGDVDGALRFAQISEETGEEGDVVNQILLRTARARALERAGKLAEAEAIAREAAAIAIETDFLYFQPFVLLDLAHVLRSAGKETEAVPVVEEALALCERKGNVPLAERARGLLAELAALKA